jgi:stage V sporulation protein S
MATPPPAVPAPVSPSATSPTASKVPLSPQTPPDASESSDATAPALKVSASSRPAAVAGAIAGMIRERGKAEVQAIGAGAINQAVKAIAIARGYLAPAGVDLICVPGFVEVLVEAEERTAIKLLVEPR